MTITRRGTLTTGGALLGTTLLARAAAAETDRFSAQVDEGLAVFRRRAAAQRPLARALTEAIRSGDLARAQAAYVASRPPYEEIEVLAASFPDRDTAIDARPYAFEDGETDEGFKGFHKVEALLFRDENLAAALPVAEELEGSLEALERDLRTRGAFSAAKTFAGLLALSTEIGAKKISSEEETWSDRSLLIFRHNLLGIESQFRPFAAELARRKPLAAEAAQGALRQAMSSVDAVYGDEPGGRPYSGVRTAERRAIVRGAYACRGALAGAAEVLGLA